jgi:hypothetical protein
MIMVISATSVLVNSMALWEDGFKKLLSAVTFLVSTWWMDHAWIKTFKLGWNWNLSGSQLRRTSQVVGTKELPIISEQSVLVKHVMAALTDPMHTQFKVISLGFGSLLESW